MRATSIILLPFIMAMLAPSGVLAQIARKPLLPEGQLFLPVGSISPMEEDMRVYGAFGVTTGDAAFTDGTNSDVDADSIAAALDFKGDSVFYSVGYSLNTITQSAGGVEQENEITNIGGRISFPFGESGMAGIEAFVEDETVTVSGPAASDSTDTGILDIFVGAGADISENLRLAGAYSPEVSDEGRFTGALAGFLIRNGHGAIIGVGLGYNTPDLAAGLEYSTTSESQDAFDNAGRAITAEGEVLLGEMSLTGQLVFFQEDILRVNGNLISPDSEGTIIGVLAKFRIGGGVLGLQLERLSEESFATGNPAEDADRLDSVDLTLFAVRFSADF